MSRAIDALELKRSISASVLCEDGKRIFDIIDEQPTIEPERKTGEWVLQDTSYWRSTHAGDVQINRVNLKCSVCGWRNHERKDYIYCPNCGASMAGDNE